jgi:hypothetical protein
VWSSREKEGPHWEAGGIGELVIVGQQSGIKVFGKSHIDPVSERDVGSPAPCITE